MVVSAPGRLTTHQFRPGYSFLIRFSAFSAIFPTYLITKNVTVPLITEHIKVENKVVQLTIFP
jgi:hypothetical protein